MEAERWADGTLRAAHADVVGRGRVLAQILLGVGRCLWRCCSVMAEPPLVGPCDERGGERTLTLCVGPSERAQGSNRKPG